MAQQEDPVWRRVALKVIKLGMDTKAVIARFEAERQALALVDGTPVPKVIDFGIAKATQGRLTDATHFMDDRAVKGTTGWAQCTITLEVAPDAEYLTIGLFVVGTGTAWFYDLRLEIVGHDVPTTPHRPVAYDGRPGVL